MKLTPKDKRGWSGGAMGLGKLAVPGRPTNLDNSSRKAFFTCSRCEWGNLDIFSPTTFVFFYLSLSGRRPDIDLNSV